ncbi:MAG: HNH endonuclease signature motif containing protein [Methyloceanibacter sp.]|uniref:HNH endonuclease signature motif containing protein n=1 Tax=Methyloceanibacter sp. TaxID=1965321 RepID=UPI003EE0E0E6
MPPVKVCHRCGNDVPVGQRCAVCGPYLQAARRNPGYDDSFFRKVKRQRRRDKATCEKCGLAPGEILHHKDGDPQHNPRDGSNYVWACASCARMLDKQMRIARDGPKGKASPWK